MEILLSGPDWKFKGFVPYEALHSRVFSPDYDHSSWRQACVPGNVQLDCLANGIIEDPYVDMLSRHAEWVSERQWVYIKRFEVPAEFRAKHVRLIFEGIDYSASIYLNGHLLGSHENLFIPAEFDVSNRLKYDEDNLLAVLLDPAPEEQAQIGWTSKVKTMKPRMPYGWDFAVRLIPIGIWKDVKLVATEGIWISDCFAETDICENGRSASLTLQVELKNACSGSRNTSAPVGLSSDVGHAAKESACARHQSSDVKRSQTMSGVRIEGVICFEGNEIARAFLDISPARGESKFALDFVIDEPKLWWPNGYGSQNLYEVHILLSDYASGRILDEKHLVFGFKTIRLEPNPGQPDGLHPWCFVINGQRVFIKGWNWVPVDNMYGGDYTARYIRLIRLAKEANANLLRVWGGGLIEKEVFYELCDRAGIMVWQEFPLSSSGLDSDPPSNPEYLSMIENAAKHIIRSRRNYACHAVWCGGNELQYCGKEDAVAKTLREICKQLDPSKPFIATSPLRINDADMKGPEDLHGGWQYFGPRRHYETYSEIETAFHSEFGAEGAANPENVPSFIRDLDLWPPSKANEIWTHRGDWWVNTHVIESMFGSLESIAEFFRFSQFLQWEGLRFIVEQDRARKFACGGTIPWQFNEPWPNLICTNVVDWYTMPKMAYYSVAHAYSPILVGARFAKLDWRAGEIFRVGIFLASSLADLEEASVDYFIMDMSGQVLCGGRMTFDSPANAATDIGGIEWAVPDGFEELFFLKLVARDATGGMLAENTYIFSAAPPPIFGQMRSLPETTLRILGSKRHSEPSPMPPHPMAAARRAGFSSQSGEAEPVEETVLTVEIANDGPAYAFFVRADALEGKRDVFFLENYLMLAPQDRATFRIKMARSVANFTFSGWNTNEVSLP